MKKIFIAAAVAFLAPQVQAAPAEACIFGSDIFEISQNPRFTVKEDVITTFKMSRGEEGGSRLVMVAIDVIKDKKSKREFQLNRTFRHKEDGDNTWGWIEEVTGSAQEDSGVKGEGAIVALVGDSEIYDCTVTK